MAVLMGDFDSNDGQIELFSKAGLIEVEEDSVDTILQGEKDVVVVVGTGQMLLFRWFQDEELVFLGG